MEKVWLQIKIPSKKINIVIYFENLTIELYILYVLNIHIKFYINWMLFTIRFIILFFMF